MPKRIASIADLTPDSQNANRGTERGRGMLEQSLRKYGAGRSVLADKHGTLIAGNKTVEAAGEIDLPIREVHTDGRELVVVVRDDLDLGTDKAARALAYADNRVSQVSLEWDLAQIGADVEAGIDLSALWGVDELAALINGDVVTTEGLTDPDAVPALPTEPITKPGDLWMLGRHRVGCGDSTVITDVDRLMDGAVADLLLTDPPYGVAYVGKTRDALTIQNDNLGDEGTRALVCDALTIAPLKPGGAFYVCSPAGNTETAFRLAIADAGMQLRQCLVWVKQHFVMGRQDYHWRHESVLYGWRDGAAHYFIDDRTQDTIADDPLDVRAMSKADLLALVKEYQRMENTSVVREDRPMSSAEHPTMKPVALMAKFIRNSSRPGAIVLDPFAGSGTTLIAAEMTGRSARLLDISPAYCDVIVNRWEAFTGGQAVRHR